MIREKRRARERWGKRGEEKAKKAGGREDFIPTQTQVTFQGLD
jgi:hypothetical protein